MEKPGKPGAEQAMPGGRGGECPHSGGGKMKPCFVVGIGASAGGQEPLEQLFTALPEDCQLAFVVVMHLPADGPLLLSDLIRRYTPMEVVTVQDGTPLLPNRVHVAPPGAELTVQDGRLRVAIWSGMATPGANHPIDRLFGSLAADCGTRAMAVILSGFGTDGAKGIKEIKGAGGAALVQDPKTALHSSMPENAVATGVVDMVLPVEEIPAKIAEMARGRCRLPHRACQTTSLDQDLNAIFSVVKVVTGHDFSSYKRNTVMRRIERRMTVNESGGLRKYLAFLEQNPTEAQALAQEILIGVTRFFRDEEAFEVLRSEVIPQLFTGRNPEDPVRIWHACCATGEEAYSVAMLVREFMEREKLHNRVQIFATDIDEGAVAQGRSGLYADDIREDVGEERFRTFFTSSSGRVRVVKELREMILFANHSIIKDPPFSRLDLLVCRNFLIYLNPDLQKRLISLFHLVLKPGGYLFLGASESVGSNAELFSVANKKWKIFQRLECERRDETFFPFVAPSLKITRNVPSKPAAANESPSPEVVADRLLVERYAPPCILVNGKYEAVHISPRARIYLEVPVGRPSPDILKMAREELRPALRAAIYKSFTERKPVEFRGVKLSGGEGEARVNVLVEPLPAHPSQGPLALVVLEPASAPAPVANTSDGRSLPENEFSRDALVRQLEEQLSITTEQLQFTAEQLEATNEGFMATNEELMSINEEYQSANEELQSTNEELEASKEELQALNEELITVNAELQGKIEELNQAGSDMENLFASSGIATIFLDRQLIIRSFSPVMAGLLNLIPSDIGRPFRHLGGAIDWSRLPEDAREVLDKHLPVARKIVSRENGRCFIMRVLPYRTTEGRVDGIVVTLVDITEQMRAEDEIRSTALFPTENPSPVLRIGGGGEVFFANKPAEVLLSEWREEFGKQIPDHLRLRIDEALSDGILREHDIFFGGSCMSFNVVPFPDRGYANLYGRDITERKRAEEAAQQAKEEWERTFDSVPDLIAILDSRHRITRVNRAMAEKLGSTAAECTGKTCFKSVHGTDEIPDFCPHALTMKDGLEHTMEVHEEHLGGDFLVTTTPLKNAEGRMSGAVHVARDISERKKMENALRESEQRVRKKLESILSPEGDIGNLQLEDIVDIAALQSLLEDFYDLSGIPMGLLDLQGKRLVGVGWKKVCTDFHRMNPLSRANCVESDTLLSTGVPEGEYKIYKCKNGMWDIATPIKVGGKHLGNLFLGQFFFDNEQPDYDFFRSQAARFGFPEEEYLAAVDAVPRFSRETVDKAMAFFMKLAGIISRLSYTNIELARTLGERETLMTSLRESEQRLNRAQEIAHLGCWELDLVDNVLTWSDEVYRIFGLQPREFGATFEAFLEAVHPADRPAVAKAYQSSLQEGRDSYKIEHRVVRKSTGEVRHVLEKCEHFRDATGKIVRSVGMVHDITEAKQAEEALRQRESFYRQTLESIPGMVFTTRPDGYCDYQSRQWVDYTGVPMEEHLGDGWNRLLHPEDRARAREAWRAAVEGRTHYDLEYRVRRLDGIYEWFKVIGRPILDEEGRIVRWFGVAINIEALKSTEQALRTSEERLYTIFNSAHDAIFVHTCDQKILAVNDKMLEMYGVSRKEALHSRRVLDFSASEGQEEQAREIWRDVLAGNPRLIEWGARNIATGKVFDVEIYLSRLEYDGQEAILATVRDITGRKRVQKELTYANQRLDLLAMTAGRLLASDAPQLVVDELCRKVMGFLDCQFFFNFLVDEKAGRLRLNAFAGVPDEEFKRIEWLDFGDAVCGCAARDGCRVVVEDIPSTADPRTELVESYGVLAYACHPLMVQGRVLGTLSFGTRSKTRFAPDELALMKAVADQVAIAMERKQAEEALQQAHNDLETKVKERTAELRDKDRLLLQQSRQAAMGEMINNIAHQWRQPLNGLGLIIQSLPMMFESKQISEDYLESVGDKAMQIIFHMSQTIDDFRNYFKPEKEKVRFPVRQSVVRTIKLVEGSFRNLDIAIELKAADDPVIYGYPNEFGQVLLNILTNARDAFCERKVKRPNIAINLGTENERAVVTINDNAGGIAEDILDKIFEPYFTTKGPEHGTGIGLFMSKTIIEKNMGGKLVVRNTMDGAEFRIEV